MIGCFRLLARDLDRQQRLVPVRGHHRRIAGLIEARRLCDVFEPADLGEQRRDVRLERRVVDGLVFRLHDHEFARLLRPAQPVFEQLFAARRLGVVENAKLRREHVADAGCEEPACDDEPQPERDDQPGARSAVACEPFGGREFHGRPPDGCSPPRPWPGKPVGAAPGVRRAPLPSLRPLPLRRIGLLADEDSIMKLTSCIRPERRDPAPSRICRPRKHLPRPQFDDARMTHPPARDA